jgi:hypothetical protein
MSAIPGQKKKAYALGEMSAYAVWKYTREGEIRSLSLNGHPSTQPV